MSNHQERRYGQPDQITPTPPNGGEGISRRGLITALAAVLVGAAATYRGVTNRHDRFGPLARTPITTSLPPETSRPKSVSAKDRINSIEKTPLAEQLDWRNDLLHATADLFAERFPTHPRSEVLMKNVRFVDSNEFTEAFLRDNAGVNRDPEKHAPLIPLVHISPSNVVYINTEEIKANTDRIRDAPDGRGAEAAMTRSMILYGLAVGNLSHHTYQFEKPVLTPGTDELNGAVVGITNFKLTSQLRDGTGESYMFGLESALGIQVASIICNDVADLIMPGFKEFTYIANTSGLFALMNEVVIPGDRDARFAVLLKIASGELPIEQYVKMIQNVTEVSQPESRGKNFEGNMALSALGLLFEGALPVDTAAFMIYDSTNGFGAGIPIIKQDAAD